MRRVAAVALALVALLALLWLAGALLPREHRATCRATFHAGPDAVFAAIADVDAYPSWRAGVTAVERAEPVGGKESFVEASGDGRIRYVVEASEPPRRRVTRIADDSLPFGGTWTFELAPTEGGTALSITEDGFVEPALFRVLARFVFGHHASMQAFLESLAAKLGERVTVEKG